MGMTYLCFAGIVFWGIVMMWTTEIVRKCEGLQTKEINSLWSAIEFHRREVVKLTLAINQRFNSGIPTHAKLLLGRNKVYPIVNIQFKTQQVMLQENEHCFNTVDFKDVEFIADGQLNISESR